MDVVAAGRRNNPPEPGVPALCAYNPLHYMELPELYMEFISSMTGKSPSTTGAGSEGALTKAPFNALPTVYDLNASLLSYALGGYDGWLSSAGYIGPKVKVAHDISLLIPELFSRMSHAERDAKELIAKGCLERIEDFEYEAARLRLAAWATASTASSYVTTSVVCSCTPMSSSPRRCCVLSCKIPRPLLTALTLSSPPTRWLLTATSLTAPWSRLARLCAPC